MVLTFQRHSKTLRILLQATLPIIPILLDSFPIYGAAVDGHFRTGWDTVRAKLRNESEVSSEIKSTSLSSNLDVGFTQLNETADAIIFDVRHRYDDYSKADRQSLDLDNKNAVLVNRIAYQRPWENNRVYFKLGRFELPDAGIYRHDGGEVGYRLNVFHRISIFGGQASKDVWVSWGRATDEKTSHRQEQGVFWVYEKNGSGDDKTVFISNSLGQSPSQDWAHHYRRTFIYHNSLLQMGTRHRFSNQINLDLAPLSIIRQAYLSYQYLDDVYQFTSFYNRLAADDFRLARDLQDNLLPSKLDTLGFSLVQQIGPAIDLEYRFQGSRRSVDALQRKSFSFGSHYRGFSQGRKTLGAMAGVRDDFLSKDNFLELQFDVFQQHTSFHLDQEFSRRRYKDRDILFNQSRSLVELAFYFNEEWQGSTAWSITHHSRADINTFYIMIGYSFAGNSTAPPPIRVPNFQEW